jgi:peroxiredoxin
MKFKGFLFFLLITGSFAVMAQRPPLLPDFKFSKLDGTPFSKNEVKAQGKSIFIYFDPTCDHCQREIESIGKQYKEFTNVSFYLVSTSVKAEVSTFMQTYGKLLKDKKNVTVLLDTKREFIPKFSPTQYPAIYVYSQGKLVKYFSGTTNVKDILAVI